MFGLIGKIRAVEGHRDDLMKILAEATTAMPGCIAYIIAADEADDSAFWVSEVWVDEQRHQASLQLPEVQAALAKGRPMIAGFESQVRTRPLGVAGSAIKPA